MMNFLLTPRGALLTFIALISLYRLSVIGGIPVSPDEAYYWSWSRSLAVCYYDQPGMTAWVNRLFSLPGETSSAFSLRLAAVVLSGLSSWLCFMAYREYRRDEREAALFAIAFSVLPFTWLLGIIMIHDTALLPWLALTFWMLFRLARRDGRALDWLLFSLALTGAMLTKFSAAMVSWGLLLYMIFSPKGRRWFRTWPPYAAGALSALLYSPVIIWNWRNDWIGLQALRELTPVKDLSWAERLFSALEYIGSQVGIFSPLIGIIVFAALVKGVRDAIRNPADDQVMIPVCCSVPVFLYFLQQSFKSHVFGNWPGIAYLPVSMLAMKELAEAWQKGRRGGLFGTRLASAGMILNLGLILIFSLHFQFRLFRPLLSALEDRFQLEKRIDHRLDKDFGGWEAMVQLVEPARSDADFVFSRNYQLASMLEFMLPDQPRVECLSVGRRQNQWDVWGRLETWEGRTGLYVDTKKMPAAVRAHCEQVRPVAEKVVVGEEPRPIKTWFVYQCIGFKLRPGEVPP